jgi:hypothetical protein
MQPPRGKPKRDEDARFRERFVREMSQIVIKAMSDPAIAADLTNLLDLYPDGDFPIEDVQRIIAMIRPYAEGSPIAVAIDRGIFDA